VVAAGIVALSGCPTTRQTRSVEKSGFLGDYSQLREGGMGEASSSTSSPGSPGHATARWRSTRWRSGRRAIQTSPVVRRAERLGLLVRQAADAAHRASPGDL